MVLFYFGFSLSMNIRNDGNEIIRNTPQTTITKSWLVANRNPVIAITHKRAMPSIFGIDFSLISVGVPKCLGYRVILFPVGALFYVLYLHVDNFLALLDANKDFTCCFVLDCITDSIFHYCFPFE